MRHCTQPFDMMNFRQGDPLSRRMFRGRCLCVGSHATSIKGLPRGDLSYVQPTMRAGLEELPKNSFDIVYIERALQAFRDPEGALKLLFSCVKPGGFLALLVASRCVPGIHPFNRAKLETDCLESKNAQSAAADMVTTVQAVLDGVITARIALLDAKYNYLLQSQHSYDASKVFAEVVFQKRHHAFGSVYGRLDIRQLLNGAIVSRTEYMSAERLRIIRDCIQQLSLYPRRTFVESGCQMQDDDVVPISTSVWASAALEHGARLWTVQSDHDTIKQCKLITSGYDNISYAMDSSIDFLRAFNSPIDFLALHLRRSLVGDPLTSERQQLAELQAAFPKLASHAVVLLEDPGAPPRHCDCEILPEQSTRQAPEDFLLSSGARRLGSIPSAQCLYVLPELAH